MARKARKVPIIPEYPRRCSRCGYQWWARKVTAPPGRKVHWYDDAASFTGNATARSIRLTQQSSAANATRARQLELFIMCGRCGSHHVSTVSEKDFVPTALAEAQQQDPGSSSRPYPSEVGDDRPKPSPERVRKVKPTPPVADGERTFEIGSRVRLSLLGSRGKVGVVTRRTKFGYIVQLDGGRLTKTINIKYLEPE